RKAGARELYAVVSVADLPAPGPFLLAFTDGDPDAARQVLAELRLETAEVIPGREGVVFAGPKAARARLRGLKASPRPELEKALAATAGAAAQAVIVPGEDLRRVAAEALPKLPKELGGGSGAALTRGFRWATLAVEVAPR